MKAYRRVLVTVGLAATLPVLAFSGVQVYFSLQERTAAAERAAVASVDRVNIDVDARLQSEFAALRILAGAASFEADDFPAFYVRAAGARAENPDWVTLALYDVDAQRWVFDLRWTMGSDVPASGGPTPPPASSIAGRAMAGHVERMTTPPPPAVAWLYQPVSRGGRVAFVLALAVDTAALQRILLSNVPADVVGAIVDADGRFLARTIGFQDRVGTSSTEFVRAAIAAGEHGFYRGRTFEGFENYTAFRTSAASGWSTHVAIASTLIDQPTRWSNVAASIAAVAALLLVGALGRLVVRDLAERRDAERAMMQSQKMEAVGRLTGGIAHDFNNLLTAIIGNLGLLRPRLADRPELERLATLALEAAQRSAKLSSQLLAFSRSQRMQLEPIDLEELLSELHDLLVQTLGPAVELSVSVEPASPRVLCDKNQLELAILNLAANSRDAMPDGGRLEISTRSALPRERLDGPPRDYVVITVADNGSGMSDDVRSRALEPFFTTKPLGKGTGLGLAQVYGVASAAGGTVRIDSAVGAGTRIEIVLPAADGEVASTSTAARSGAGSVAGTPRAASILVVDDDAAVRAFLVEALQTGQHRVREAETPEAAIELLAAEPFDLMVVDYLMPQMTGAELVARVRKRWPELRVLFISGYHDSAALAAAAGAARLLRKPFDVVEFTDAVSELLADHRSSQ